MTFDLLEVAVDGVHAESVLERLSLPHAIADGKKVGLVVTSGLYKEPHIHERVEKAGREPALDDERSEAGARREVRVEVQRVVVAGEGGEGLDVMLSRGQRTTGLLADVRRSGQNPDAARPASGVRSRSSSHPPTTSRAARSTRSHWSMRSCRRR